MSSAMAALFDRQVQLPGMEAQQMRFDGDLHADRTCRRKKQNGKGQFGEKQGR